ncbi:MAG: N-acetylmuramoyl-L-alanine amidase [Elusimicrobiales bacterium]
MGRLQNYIGIAAALSLLCGAPALAARRAETPSEYGQIQVSESGEFRTAVKTLRLGGALLADARDTARALGGSAALSRGRLELRFAGLTVKLRMDSRQAVFGSAAKTLSAPVIMSGGKPFVPVEVFTAPELGAALSRSIDYNDTAKSLDIDKLWQVGGPDYSSLGPVTELSFELRGVSGYATAQPSPSTLEITIPGASAQSCETLPVNDGLVDRVSVSEAGGGVKISVYFENEKAVWNVSRDSGSLAVEVSVPELAAGAGGDTAKPQPPEAAAPPHRELETAATIQERLNIPDSIVDQCSGKRLIVIDAGHGGKDPGGSRRRGVVEKTLNLAVAKELSALFKNNAVFTALLTRATDYFIPLDGRCDIANSKTADMFVSIHANAHKRRSERGFEVYFMSEDAKDPWAKQVAASENAVRGLESASVPREGLLLHSLARAEYMNESAVLAGFIAASLAQKSPVRNRGVNQAPFYVLRGTYAPAVLVEMGFMTNPKEAALLSKASVQKKIAQGVYDGVMAYAKSKGWNKKK